MKKELIQHVFNKGLGNASSLVSTRYFCGELKNFHAPWSIQVWCEGEGELQKSFHIYVIDVIEKNIKQIKG